MTGKQTCNRTKFTTDIIHLLLGFLLGQNTVVRITDTRGYLRGLGLVMDIAIDVLCTDFVKDFMPCHSRPQSCTLMKSRYLYLMDLLTYDTRLH